MADGGRRKPRAQAQAAARSAPPQTCPECGTRMVRAITGMRCPRFSACGRGGMEETGAKIKRNVAHRTGSGAADAPVG